MECEKCHAYKKKVDDFYKTSRRYQKIIDRFFEDRDEIEHYKKAAMNLRVDLFEESKKNDRTQDN
jgi:hypothetical protein